MNDNECNKNQNNCISNIITNKSIYISYTTLNIPIRILIITVDILIRIVVEIHWLITIVITNDDDLRF